MAAEYGAQAQTLAPGESVVFTLAPVPCNRGLIYHRPGSGLFRLASAASMGIRRRCCCAPRPTANYSVIFHASIALAEGGTPGPISLALYVDDQEDIYTEMITEAAAVGEFQTVSAATVVSVPAICTCASFSVRNSGDQTIDLNVGNVVFTGVEIR